MLCFPSGAGIDMANQVRSFDSASLGRARPRITLVHQVRSFYCCVGWEAGYKLSTRCVNVIPDSWEHDGIRLERQVRGSHSYQKRPR